MTESEWTRKVCNDLKRCNALVFAAVGSDMQAPGWPDRYVHHARWCGWLEFKGENTRVTRLQEARIRELNVRRPGSAYILRWPGILENVAGVVIARLPVGWGAKELLQTLEKL